MDCSLVYRLFLFFFFSPPTFNYKSIRWEDVHIARCVCLYMYIDIYRRIKLMIYRRKIESNLPTGHSSFLAASFHHFDRDGPRLILTFPRRRRRRRPLFSHPMISSRQNNVDRTVRLMGNPRCLLVIAGIPRSKLYVERVTFRRFVDTQPICLTYILFIAQC